MSVTLLEVMAAAKTRAASLVSEVSGYVVLGAADQVVGAPRALGGQDVWLGEEGGLRVAGGRAASELEAEAGLRTLLARLLSVSVSVTPALLRASEKRPSGDLAQFVRELEAALIPVNRAAARRALARLFRDVDRAKASGRIGPIEAEPLVDDEPSIGSAVVSPLPEVQEERAPRALEVEIDVELAEPEPVSVEPPLFADRSAPLPEPVTRPEPIALRRSIPEPSELSPMVPSPVVMWDVPELELPPSPELADVIVAEHETEPPLELAGADATDRAPTLMTHELTVPLAPPVAAETLDTPHAPPPVAPAPIAREPIVLEPPRLDDWVDDAPWHRSSDHTPALRDLVTVARALRSPERAGPDPDELVIEQQRTAPLPEVAIASPPAPTLGLPEYDEWVDFAASDRAPLLACDAPPVAPPPALPPIAPAPVIALEPLTVAPERPRPIVPAPPRYQPKQSDVDELVRTFAVSEAPPERALRDDLKRLAGVDRTQAPPAVSTQTPPPVEVGSEAAERPSSTAPRSRIGLGVLALALVASGAGAVSSAVSKPPSAGARSDAFAESAQSCDATLELSDVPAGARALVRAGSFGSSRIPSRVDGETAVFEGLTCGEPLEVTVGTEQQGQRRWVRIPVSAARMSPDAHAPSRVRVALSVK